MTGAVIQAEHVSKATECRLQSCDNLGGTSGLGSRGRGEGATGRVQIPKALGKGSG